MMAADASGVAGKSDADAAGSDAAPANRCRSASASSRSACTTASWPYWSSNAATPRPPAQLLDRREDSEVGHGWSSSPVLTLLASDNRRLALLASCFFLLPAVALSGYHQPFAR